MTAEDISAAAPGPAAVAGATTRRVVGDTGLNRVAMTCLVILIALKLQFMIFAAPLADEAYYWLWGQRPDFSYFDHPPLQAWVQGLLEPLVGRSYFALRLPALLSTLGIAAMVLWWVREAQRHGHAISAPVALAVFFATPLFYLATTLVFPDYLSILLISLSCLLFFKVLNRVASGGRISPLPLYGAALALGLAALAKHNAAFFGVAVAVAIAVHRPYRPLLKSPHLYLAAVLSVACLAPVIYWNLANDWVSLQYNLSDRLRPEVEALRLVDRLWSFAGNSMLGYSVFVHAGLAVLILRRPAEPWLGNWRVLAIAAFALPTLFWLGAMTITRPESYWNIIAYVPFLPLAALWMARGWIIKAHLVVGVICAAAVNFHFTVLPLSALTGDADPEGGSVYGWPAVAEAVERQWRAQEADFIATTYYRTGAVLAFMTGNTGIEVVSERNSQFDLWFDDEKRAGQDAILLSDDRQRITDYIRARFGDIQLLETVPVRRFGRDIRDYRIFLAKGYIPGD